MDDIDLNGKKLFLVAMYAEETVKRELEKEFNQYYKDQFYQYENFFVYFLFKN